MGKKKKKASSSPLNSLPANFPLTLSSFVAFGSQEEQNGAQEVLKAVLNIQMHAHRHTADIPARQVGVGLDVIWDNKDQRAIKEHNPQQILIIQSRPGGRRRLFLSWPPWCSGILFSLESSELSSFGSCPPPAALTHGACMNKMCIFKHIVSGDYTPPPPFKRGQS